MGSSRNRLLDPQWGRQRRVLFAIELIDAVTLERVSEGIKIAVEGLPSKPIVNASGLFVWVETAELQLNQILLDPSLFPVTQVSIDPGTSPYQAVTLNKSDLKLPLTTVELAPELNYPFSAGVTVLRGSVFETRLLAPQPPTAVKEAKVQLRWLDENNIWRDASTVSRTSKEGGDFAAVLRLAPADVPLLAANGTLTARLRVDRESAGVRSSIDIHLAPGRIDDASHFTPPNFSWDELS